MNSFFLVSRREYNRKKALIVTRYVLKLRDCGVVYKLKGRPSNNAVIGKN